MNRQRRAFVHRFFNRYIDNPQYRHRQPSQSIRKSKQCASDTLLHRRCRKRTAHSPKCWIHLEKQNNLRIKPSSLINGGKGLYNWKKPIRKGSIISKYTGRYRTKQQIDKKYGDGRADYALCNSRGRCIDANHTTDGAARFVNDARNSPFQHNSVMRGDQMFRLKATAKIPSHNEIFTSYGREYWL
jgi:hypothetical protein